MTSKTPYNVLTQKGMQNLILAEDFKESIKDLKNDLDKQEEFLLMKTGGLYGFYYFCLNYLKIRTEDEDKGTFEIMDFDLWDWQFDAIATIHYNNRVVACKSRQVGLSWISLAYVLWDCLFNKNRYWLIVSDSDKDAKILLEKVAVLYDYLPDWLKYDDIKPTKEFFTITPNRSKIEVRPSTPRIRGESYSGVIFDEAAHHMFADKVLEAVEPTTGKKGKLILISTPNGMEGVGSLFFNTVQKAQDKADFSEWEEIRVYWWMHPTRISTEKAKQIRHNYIYNGILPSIEENKYLEQEIWFLKKKASYVSLLSFKQEFLMEFAQAGSPVFSAEYLALIIQKQIPIYTESYVIGVDTASGSIDGDFSVAQVLNSKGEQVHTLRGRYPPDVFAGMLVKLSIDYNNASLLIEHKEKSAGAVIQKLKDLNFTKYLLTHNGKLGFDTNSMTKPQIIHALEEALRKGYVKLSDNDTLKELRTYVYLKNQSMGGIKGTHDDTVMALAIAYFALTNYNITGYTGVMKKPKGW